MGGSIAIAFAFTRLAAITAAMLLFFVGDTESVGLDNELGLGHAFSSCLRAVGSRPAIIDVPLSFHTEFNSQ